MKPEETIYKVTVYQNFRQNLGESNLTEILMSIKNGKFEDVVNSIRYAYHKGDIGKGDKLKKELIAFTCSGTFTGSRLKENLNHYSHVICVDFDDVPMNELERMKAKVMASPFTYACFISPSGMGLKVLVRVNTPTSDHSAAYVAVGKFYTKLTGQEFDASCKDITRLCFVSFDPECYLNSDAIEFHIDSSTDVQSKDKQKKSEGESLEHCLRLTENIAKYEHGNRNNFVFLFVSNCNRLGIHENATLIFSLAKFDLSEREIISIVRNVYRNHSAEFAKFAESAESPRLGAPSDSSNSYDEVLMTDDLNRTPIIPENVYAALPDFIKAGTSVFSDNRQKDVYLTTAIAILSGCLPNVKGLYSGLTVFTNLFSFVLAPPASNKGSLTLAKELAKKYHT